MLKFLKKSSPLVNRYGVYRRQLITLTENTSTLPKEPCSTAIVFQDFNDPKSAHETKSFSELLSSLVVFRLCRMPMLVHNSEFLMSVSNNILGTTITNTIVKNTFFKQFCAGESATDIKPTLSKLKSCGIGGILDYAAESDIPDTEPYGLTTDIVSEAPNQPARVYSYESESKCDAHVDVFKACIKAVRDVTPDGFAAIKITALGNPILLERMSIAITEAKNLFSSFDTNFDGIITREGFIEGYQQIFKDAGVRLPELLDRLDPNNTNVIDYIEWSKLLTPFDLPRLTCSFRKAHHPLALATPSPQEIKLMAAMLSRADALANEAYEHKVRLLIDAEQYRYQPAIDNITLSLQRKYNSFERSEVPIIFNTYQCYLKDMPNRMKLDVERAVRHSYHFGAKLVRGAYMNSERERAMKMGYPSPINDTIEDTHTCYDNAMAYLLNYRANHKDSSLEVMCATHNQSSIVKAIELATELGIKPDDSALHFAQLLGMSDNLTYALGKRKFQAYKYVPYGPVQEVIPYLLRRAQENSAMLEKSKFENKLILQELKRRVLS